MKSLVLAFSLISALLVNPAMAYQVQNAGGKIQITLDPTSKGMVQQVDILFVVDDSGSMQSYQNFLSSRMQDLIQKLKGRDIHAGVLTTSADKYSKGPGIIRWVSSKKPGWDSELQTLVMPGTNGSADERPLESIMLSISEPQLTQNKDFFRAGTDLVVVLLTDAEDQSLFPVTDFVSQLSQFKGDASRIGFHGIIVPSTVKDCPRDGGMPTRVEGVIAAFNGLTVSMCDSSSFSHGLSDIADDIAKRQGVSAFRNKILLPLAPDLTTLKVTYGPKILLGGDFDNGWYYIAKDQTLYFGLKIDWPSEPAGTELVISYVPTKWEK